MQSRYLPRALACLALSSAVASALAAGDSLIAKQLAGPPEDFAMLSEIAPEATAIHSKSALIPIELEAERDGSLSWTGKLPVSGNAARFLVFAGDGSAWRVEVAGPSGGASRQSATPLSTAGRTSLGIENAQHAADLYSLSDAENGAWTITVRADGDTAQRRGYLLIEGDHGTELTSHQTHRRQWTGERIGLVAMLSSNDVRGAAVVGANAGTITEATLRITTPGGGIESAAMYDDGLHGDGARSDGEFGGEFVANGAGQYLAQVEVRGTDLAGSPLARTSEHVIPVIDRAIDVNGTRAFARADASVRDRFKVAVPVSARNASQHYRAYAELWGTDARGRSVPVAWLGGMVTPVDGKVELGLDARWLARAGVAAPYELRAVRLEDPDHFVTVSSADRLALGLPGGSSKFAGDNTIDDTMRMGVKPVELAQRGGQAINGVGKRLLLVHGYCSGGVWPASQFATSSSFLDANQNRSHDAFARLIQSFGATWNSFGVVAHSQGGAASLHLYNYYWSGLDNATGARLIQSVGTPYQGTNLAGILATLGSWFGAGCGTNDNLSYSGAASWMAGIPTASRAKVNFYTTAFRTTNWWTNDYCHAATDLVLSDPEDGTTEKAYGQLPGAVNRGHFTGQCHTAGMRDPAQYHDTARNSTMSVNAAR